MLVSLDRSCADVYLVVNSKICRASRHHPNFHRAIVGIDSQLHVSLFEHRRYSETECAKSFGQCVG